MKLSTAAAILGTWVFGSQVYANPIDSSDIVARSVGTQILAKAKTAKGYPYAWGGGNCKGATKAIDGTSDVGFDCSGLVCWAVCQVTGRDLFSEGLRNTQTMYCASSSKLKYKKVPYKDRRAGDAVLFGGKCDCDVANSIHHIGLMMEDGGDTIWNAPNDRVNQVQVNKISDFDAPCPYVIRFSEGSGGNDPPSGGSGKYVSFPGASWFKSSPNSSVVTAMGKRLVEEGCSAYKEGPGPQWTDADRQSYAKWQKKLGYTGADADGWPGETSWKKLKVPK